MCAADFGCIVHFYAGRSNVTDKYVFGYKDSPRRSSSATTMTKALIAITSYNDVFYDSDGAKTGLFISEAIHPFEYFKANGVEVDFVSETGTFGYDDHSLSQDFLNGKDREVYEDANSDYNKAIKNVKKASDVSASDYDIFFAAGGHGTLFDFPSADGLHALASSIYANKGVVAAVCHGPLIFDNLNDKETGKPLIEGKTGTGFTDEGEVIMGLDDKLKRDNLVTVKAVIEKVGGKYVPPAGPWDDYSVADGRVVTGANPASATSTAEKALAALKAA